MAGESDIEKAAGKLGIPLWGRLTLAGIVALVLLGLSALWVEHDKFNRTDIQLTKIRDSIRLLAEKTPHEDVIQHMLAMAAREVDSNVDRKISPIEKRLKELDSSVKSTGRVQEELKTRLDRQEALNRIQSPDHIIAIIRAGIQGYSSGNPQLIPASTLQDYKSAVRAIPSSASGYWETVAAIINYQSLLNQMNGQAPDPSKVATPCGLHTEGTVNSSNNLIIGVPVSNCVVDLDSNAFTSVIFLNSVVRYHGGKSYLNNVTFINCRFVLDLKQEPTRPEQTNLLIALLDSPDQKTVRVTNVAPG